MGSIEAPATSHPAALEREAVKEASDGDPEKARTFALLSVSASLERVAYALGQQKTE